MYRQGSHIPLKPICVYMDICHKSMTHVHLESSMNILGSRAQNHFENVKIMVY